ncbi:hypothetical protein RND81_11G085000 [Saponaria officinalis]|uniref:ATP-dependent DNA helicase n=1 Tax=Saponaria officinalis TaxID=3572 RepID=A0AAW1HJE8_SAPOF
MREYYAYRIQQRLNEGQTILYGGRLFQQFLVDCCCAIESERLWFIKNNQELFRCDVLNNICDAVTKGDSIGQAVGQKPDDRPDIIARVFKMKLKQLMKYVCTIEFQKRALPHAHILLWLKRDETELSTQFIDSIIHAEIPDNIQNPRLYETVSRYMIHGPCGPANPKCPCMINNICSKKFPKSFNEETKLDNNGYPVYRRRLDNSFEDIRTVNGLLNNDKEWNDAMREANHWAMPSQLIELFVTMILFCEVTDMQNLWESNYNMLSDDIEKKKRKLFGDPELTLTDGAKKSYTLIEIDKILMKYGKRLKDVNNMPQPTESDIEGMDNKLIRDEHVYDAVINAVNKKVADVIFVNGHGGTGKTFLYGTISAKLRAENKIVLNVASSGIAALLLPGGRTAYSRFEIPIDLFEESTCNVKQKSQLAELLRETSLIIWDEAPMDHRYAFEALDRTMRDIIGFTDSEAALKLFGGKVVLLGGDFRQVLPIVPKGGRQDIVQASINRSHIWQACTVYVLKTSMRVRETNSNGEDKRFNDWLFAMGDGRLEAKAEPEEDEATWIEIPDEYICTNGIIELQKVVDEIYPNFIDHSKDDNYLRERAILTPLNETDTVNDFMTNLIPGEFNVYKSCDEICASSLDNDEQFTAYPTEYLNSLHLQGLPNQELRLKEGMLVMLLRNINPSQGLYNGTRLIITRTGKFIIEARIITGSKVGTQVLIPRIVMTTTDTKIPFILKRRQYPLKPCYAMTINKSQGQTLTHVGVYLPKPVFSHGQLYVAASRTTSPRGLRFFIDDSKQSFKKHTKNIVYREVFSNL